MSYRNAIEANLDILQKSEQMYQNDLRNKLGGLGSQEQQDNESTRAIEIKLDMLRNEKEKAFIDQKRIYDDYTNKRKGNLDRDYKTTLILKKQDQELKHNYEKIYKIKNDILTLRRQVEIDENTMRKRNNKIFLLKLLFIYLIASILPILLVRNESITMNKALYILGIITTIFILAVLWNFYHARNRDKLRYNVKHWTKPSLKKALKRAEQRETIEKALNKTGYNDDDTEYIDDGGILDSHLREGCRLQTTKNEERYKKLLYSKNKKLERLQEKIAKNKIESEELLNETKDITDSIDYLKQDKLDTLKNSTDISFAQFDLDKSGQIDYDEFAKHVQRQESFDD